jgi:PiT family inorganic phosphate transporter
MGIIAAAVTVYIHTSGISQDMLPDWLDVVPPNDGDFKREMIPLFLLFILHGTLSGIKMVKTMGSEDTKVTSLKVLSCRNCWS